MIECRDCGELFNPHLPFHNENGYFNQCGFCAEDESDKRVKALTNINADGDVEDMKIVDAQTYKKVQGALTGENTTDSV